MGDYAEDIFDGDNVFIIFLILILLLLGIPGSYTKKQNQSKTAEK